MQKIFSLIGLFVFVGIAYLLSKDKKNINWRGIVLTFIVQLVVAFLMVKTPLWKVVEVASGLVEKFLSQAQYGLDFVFGSLASDTFVFFIGSLCPIVFVSGVIGIIYHFGILQKIFIFIGKYIAKIFDIDSTVVLNYVGNCIFGQTDALMLSKSKLKDASESIIFATMVGGFSSVSASVIGLYSSMGASVEWILVSLPLTVFSCIVLTQIVMPTKYNGDDLVIENDDKGENFIDTAMIFATNGFKRVIGITVALILFISLTYMINNILGAIFSGLTLEKIVGIIFYPLALLMGVPMNELGLASQLLASRFIMNEVVAFGLPAYGMLSETTKCFMTVALMGFSGIGSIAIMLGSYQAIAPNQTKVVARVGFKALVVATLATIMTGALVSLFL